MKQLYRIHNNLFSSIKNLNYKKIDRFDISNKNKFINKKVLFNNIEKMSILINESIYEKFNILRNDTHNISNDFDKELGVDFPSSRFY